MIGDKPNCVICGHLEWDHLGLIGKPSDICTANFPSACNCPGYAPSQAEVDEEQKEERNTNRNS